MDSTKRPSIDPHSFAGKYARYPQKSLQDKKSYKPTIPVYPPDHNEFSQRLSTTGGRRRTLQMSEILRGAEDERQSDMMNQQTVRDKVIGSEGIESKQYREEAEYWKRKADLLERHNKELQKHLEEIQRVRYTDAESELRNYIEWSEAKDQAFVNLKSEVEQFLQRGERSGIAIGKSSFNRPPHGQDYEKLKAAELKIAELEKEITRVSQRVEQDPRSGERNFSSMEKPILSLYEELTTTVIRSCKEMDGSYLYSCVIAGITGSFQFTLQISKDKTHMVNYSPILDPRRDDFIAVLPDFLKEEVEFEIEKLPVFFWRLSSVMNKS
ncbi:hypothetical protein BD560DRAFT_381932 [Blakeslea trispora]|nr:hypothetical protein BD560DRAFT_381932 [Blakeslea trispora]